MMTDPTAIAWWLCSLVAIVAAARSSTSWRPSWRASRRWARRSQHGGPYAKSTPSRELDRRRQATGTVAVVAVATARGLKRSLHRGDVRAARRARGRAADLEAADVQRVEVAGPSAATRSEEHTPELQ